MRKGLYSSKIRAEMCILLLARELNKDMASIIITWSDYYNEGCMRYTIILTLSLILFSGAKAMSILGIGKTCVFSAVKVRLINNGLPMKNAQVIRRWEWNSLQEDKTITDENGYFEFPAVFEKSLARILPIELVIAQGLYVVEGDEEKKIWSNSKREPEENAEFNGKTFELTCEITNEMKTYRDFGSRMRTLCTWED